MRLEYIVVGFILMIVVLAVILIMISDAVPLIQKALESIIK